MFGGKNSSNAVGAINVVPNIMLVCDLADRAQAINDAKVGGSGGRHDGKHVAPVCDCGFDGFTGEATVRIHGHFDDVA